MKYVNKMKDYARIFILLLIVLIGTAVVYNTPNISDYISTVLTNQDPLGHYTLSEDELDEVGHILSKMVADVPDIKTVVLYKFIPDKNTSLFSGQAAIAAVSEVAGDVYDDTSNGIPIFDTTRDKYIQDVLLNKVHYDQIITTQIRCSNVLRYNEEFNCSRFVESDIVYKSLVTIPIMDKESYNVNGYVIILLRDQYNKPEIETIVNNSKKHLAVLTPLLSR